jgi:hypothetical protein
MVHDEEQELLAFTGWLASENSIVVVFRCASPLFSPPLMPKVQQQRIHHLHMLLLLLYC